ncbi:hypothetical protein C8J57DRAFT_1740146 [Mycena rebaudengoi]|nr:hypothetical protein C8J57DRAFT_1740146 [Mycena rebaudengoi]
MPPRVFMYEEEEELPRRPSPPLPLNGPILEQIMFVSDSVPSAPPLLDAVGDHSASVPAALPPRQPIPSPPHMYTVPLAYGSLDRAHSPAADLPSVHPRTDLLSGPEPLDPSAPTYGVPPEVPLDRAHSEGGDVPSSVLSDRAAIDPLPMHDNDGIRLADSSARSAARSLLSAVDVDALRHIDTEKRRSARQSASDAKRCALTSTVEDARLNFPHMATVREKSAIIKDWQEDLDPQNWLPVPAPFVLKPAGKLISIVRSQRLRPWSAT